MIMSFLMSPVPIPEPPKPSDLIPIPRSIPELPPIPTLVRIGRKILPITIRSEENFYIR